MTLIGIALVIVAILAFISIGAYNARAQRAKQDILIKLKQEGFTEDKAAAEAQSSVYQLPGWTMLMSTGLLVIGLGTALFNSIWFYAEPGYLYHVRTITGEEKVVDDVGFNTYLFGRYNAWKRAMTVQATSEGFSVGTSVDAENDNSTASATLQPMNIMFLDQVDADAEATVRFSIPTDEESFLNIAHEYRSPENLLRTALIPAFKETLQATASLMTAEEYYAGGRTQFNSEFENQMSNGIYIVRRMEVSVKARTSSGSANVALGTEQEEFGEDEKTEFVVEKVLDETGQPQRKAQKFTNFGLSVVDARITDMRPNQKFVERMQLKQKASADRAIAREQRVQEEEQRLLAIAKGDREVAERQAQAKVEQIQKTTEAQTEKQLAITNAEKLLEEAEIAKETAQLELERARIEAETKRTVAEAEAFAKRQILEADNALAQKLEAEIEIQKVWAEAFAKRNVPSTVFGSGGGDGVPVGSDAEVKAFMQLLTLDAAQRLNYSRQVDQP